MGEHIGRGGMARADALPGGGRSDPRQSNRTLPAHRERSLWPYRVSHRWPREEGGHPVERIVEDRGGTVAESRVGDELGRPPIRSTALRSRSIFANGSDCPTGRASGSGSTRSARCALPCGRDCRADATGRRTGPALGTANPAPRRRGWPPGHRTSGRRSRHRADWARPCGTPGSRLRPCVSADRWPPRRSRAPEGRRRTASCSPTCRTRHDRDRR